MKEFISHSPDDTKKLGYDFAKILNKGDLVVLTGDLGAGKTMFVAGFLSFYNKENEIQSPTFTIVNEHNLTPELNFFHFDVYRLDEEEEFLAIGGEEYFSKGITIMEWGEKIKNLLPKEYLEIKIQKDENDLDKRTFIIIPHGERYEKII